MKRFYKPRAHGSFRYSYRYSRHFYKISHIKTLFDILCLRMSLDGVRWEIHKMDNDIIFPSVPHLHAVDSDLKANIYTGSIYSSKTRELAGRLSKRSFRRLWIDPRFIIIVNDERERYEKLRLDSPGRFPPLPDLPTFDKYKSQLLMRMRDLSVIYRSYPPRRRIKISRIYFRRPPKSK